MFPAKRCQDLTSRLRRAAKSDCQPGKEAVRDLRAAVEFAVTTKDPLSSLVQAIHDAAPKILASGQEPIPVNYEQAAYGRAIGLAKYFPLQVPEDAS